MKLYLTEQNLTKHLDFLKTIAVMTFDKNKLVEKTTAITLKTNKNIDKLNLDFLFNYQIFPNNIMTFKNESG